MSSICDLVIIIKNGYMSQKGIVKVKNSIFHQSVLRRFMDCGYIFDFKVNDFKSIDVILKYIGEGGQIIAAVKNFYLHSKPGGRVYVNYQNINKYYKHSRFDNLFLTTSRGILLGSEAVHQKIGGELLCGVF